MVTLICDDCGRKVETSDDYDPNATCKECGGLFSEEDSEEEYEYEEETFECQNCQEEVEEKDCVFFDDDCEEDDYNIIICKKCLAKKVNIQPQVIFKEKIVEKPIIKYIDNSGKEVQKQETNQTFNSVF